MRAWGLALAGAFLIIAGSLTAYWIQTSGRSVEVSDIRIQGDNGQVLSALLYRPIGATVEKPAPAVLVSHGFINTREMQSPFAIELSRRGYVVLAIDMSGHGGSWGVLLENGAGGPAALRYLQGLDFVDNDNIGLEGHSMGGVPVQAAAVSQPDGYRAMVLEGSATGVLGAPGEANTEFPRNLAVVFGQYDEFADTMWQVPKGSEAGGSARMMRVFGTSAPVVPGTLYGDVAAGTGRLLVTPPINHPQEHFTSVGVGAALDWFGKTLTGSCNCLDANNQVWIYKEAGTGVAFIGCVMLMLGVFNGLLSTPIFARLRRVPQPASQGRGGKWWLAFLISALLPAATYFPLMKFAPAIFFGPFALAKQLPWAMANFPEQITNQLVVWALVTALIGTVLGIFLKEGKPKFTHPFIGAIPIAALSVVAGYGALWAADALLHVDFRFWVVGLRPLDMRHALIALAYLGPFTLFFLLTQRSFAQAIPTQKEGSVGSFIFGGLSASLGFILMLGIQYGVMSQTGMLALNEPLNTIIAYQFVPLLFIIGVIGAFTYRRTGSYLPGAFICALFVTWYIVAGTAIFPAQAPGPAPRPAAPPAAAEPATTAAPPEAGT